MRMTRLHRSLALVTAAAVLASMSVATVASPASAAKPKCQGFKATIVGTKKGEVIRGTAKRDIIVAKGGNDRIYGRGGNDIICAGGGNDTVYGGPGADRLWGQLGRDRLFGNTGPDFLAGQVGNDTLVGGIGVDTCFQGTGSGPASTCERPARATPPAPAPAPAPTPGTIVIGGLGSGQVGGSYQSTNVNPAWSLLVTHPGQCSTDNYDDGSFVSVRRMAMEFRLSGLPTGATVTKATLKVRHVDDLSADVLGHSFRGYPGNGAIEVADILVGGTARTFTPSAPGSFTTVVVTDLVTPTVVASGWAGFSMRKDVTSTGSYNYWRCDLSLGLAPTLTVDYLAP